MAANGVRRGLEAERRVCAFFFLLLTWPGVEARKAVLPSGAVSFDCSPGTGGALRPPPPALAFSPWAFGKITPRRRPLECAEKHPSPESPKPLLKPPVPGTPRRALQNQLFSFLFFFFFLVENLTQTMVS